MRFSKVSLTKKGVKLFSTRTTGSGTTEEKNLRAPQEPPMQSFVDSMQAFKALVLAVLKGPVKIEPDAMTITTLNLSEDKNHLRGLIVTAVVPLPQAYGKPLVINTPLIREGGENASEDAFVLEDHHMEMIRVVEAEATAFYKGNRQQIELPLKQESANAKDVGERMAAASIDSTRKGRKGGKTGPLTTPRLRQLLLMVERDVPEEVIEKMDVVGARLRAAVGRGATEGARRHARRRESPARAGLVARRRHEERSPTDGPRTSRRAPRRLPRSGSKERTAVVPTCSNDQAPPFARSRSSARGGHAPTRHPRDVRSWQVQRRRRAWPSRCSRRASRG
jgi:hypothetical protein